MPHYDLYVSTQHKRVKYPRNLNAPDIEVAHGIALRLAQVFIEAEPSSNHPSSAARSDFAIEIVDEAGQIVLTVPGKWMRSCLARNK